jgi:hypothetical protein
VVELLAVERNEMAMKLRDQGKTEEARQKLQENVSYLQTAAKDYDCPALDKYAYDNEKQAEELDDANWNQNRKGMVEGRRCEDHSDNVKSENKNTFSGENK